MTGLCLLIRFPDVAETISRQQIDDFCNQPGYTGFSNNGSVYDYFVHASDGMLHYRNLVTAYYTAANNRAHYTDPAIPFGQRARELIVEALTSLTNAGFDFSSLTVDSGGYVYTLNVFYAGPRMNNWSQGLWPHAWGLATPYDIGSGRRLNDYQITDIGSQLSLGTFCHENGHMVCDFPDLYDYGSDSSGVGNFCLMCFGGDDKNPVEINAALKYQAGWAPNARVIQPSMTYTLAAAGNDFLIHRRSDQEYFILENRHQSPRDASIPDSGLAIWHFDAAGSNNNQQRTPTMHYFVSLEQADGRFDLENDANGGDSGDLYRPTRRERSTRPALQIRIGGTGPRPVSPSLRCRHRVHRSPCRPDRASRGSLPTSATTPVVGASTCTRVSWPTRPVMGAPTSSGSATPACTCRTPRPTARSDPPQLVVANFGYNAGGWRVDMHPRFMADTTGDGRADIVGFGNAGVYVSHAPGRRHVRPRRNWSSPTSATTPVVGGSSSTRASSPTSTGDGRADIVGFGDTGV